jgi:hypothetical protein
MFPYALRYVVCLVLVAELSGCSAVRPSAEVPLGPLFQPTSDDLPRLAHLARELDAKERTCLKAANCEQVSFARALVNLFKDREAAGASFHRVIEYSPSSPLAGTSRLWLRLIERDEEGAAPDQASSNPGIEILSQFLREWMELRLTEPVDAHRTAPPPAMAHEPSLSQGQPFDQSRVIQGMQRQLRERDRQISVLRSQLDALKFIEQDQDQRRKVKPPASLRTSEHFPER